MDSEQLLGQLPVLVYRLDPHGKILFINDEVRRYGYDPAELLGKDILTLVVPEDKSLIQHNLQERRTGNRATRNVRARFLTKDHSTRVLHVLSRAEHEGVNEPVPTIHMNLFTIGLYEDNTFVGTYGLAWDVTETVFSEELLQKMLEDSPVSMLVYDADGFILHANAIAREKLALPSEYRQIRALEIVPERDWELTRGRMQRALAGMESQPSASSFRTMDGCELTLEVRARPLVLQGENCVLLTMVDLSEREELNQRLIESEIRYRNIYEHANDAVFLMRDYTFIDCNSKTLKIFGIENKADIIGKSPVDFSPPTQANGRPSRESAFENMERALAGEPLRFNWIHLHGDGSQFPAEVVLNKFTLANETLLLAIVRDNSSIDYRFQLEELVSRIAIDFISLPLNDIGPWKETVHSAMKDVATMLKADSVILYKVYEKENEVRPEQVFYNPKYREPESLWIKIPIPLLDNEYDRYGYPEPIAVIQYNDSRTESKLQQGLNLLELRTAVNVRLNVRGSWVGTISLGWKTDYTLEPEVLKTIEFLASAFASLLERQRVFEKETLLTQQLYQAQKMEEVGRLSSGVAHDFNNLLTVILGNTELLKQLISEDEAGYEQKQELLDNLSNAADVASGLTRQLLLFSRTAVANYQRVNLNETVLSIQKMISRITPSSVIKEVRLAETIPTVSADPTHVQQIILNLSVNAVDAMPKGGLLTISTECRHHKGTQTCQLCGKKVKGKFVTLKIKDTGTGIPEDVIEKIFEPFFTTKDQGKGTGLGLATVANIVSEYSGGHLTVKSENGAGTEFEIHLPIDTDDSTLSVTGPKPDMRSSEGLSGNVVLVEDNEHLRRLLVRVLESSGLTVEAFELASLANEHFSSNGHPVDLLITDQVMPGMTGLELARLVRKEYPKVPILMISGYAPEADFDKTLQELDIPFLPKPFSTAEFLNIIHGLLHT